MASEIRVNKIENRSGLGTVTFADTGVDLAGIVTATTFSGSGASLTALPAANITGTLPAISAANLTNIPAANVTGTLPAISAANLTNVPAANITGTLPALTAANLTNIPAANLVGVCTSGLTKTGGFGKVVAQVFASSTTNEQNPSGDTTWTLVGPQITHTAASTSNKLVFLHSHHLMVEGSMTWHMALYRDGTSGTQVYQMETYTQLSANWSACTGITNVTTTAPDTSSHTYQFAIYRSTGSDSLIRYSPNSESTGSQVMLLEIEP